MREQANSGTFFQDCSGLASARQGGPSAGAGGSSKRAEAFQRLQDAEVARKQSELLELAHDAIIVRDLNYRITFWNNGAVELYGWTKEEAAGKNLHELLATESPEPLEAIQEHLLREGIWQGEVTQAVKDGRRISVETRKALQRNEKGEPTDVFEINRDITKRKNAEDSLRSLSLWLIQLQDEERRRIARELHDSTGQILAVLALNLGALCGRAKQLGPADKEALEEALNLARRASNEIRTLSYLLYPPTLDTGGLPSALQWLIDGFGKRSELQTNLEVSPELGRLPQNLETAIFRIVQEGLTNVYRHSGAALAKVRVLLEPGAIHTEISDNGNGMPAHVMDAWKDGGNSGVGIRGMSERVKQLGGSLRIESKPGRTVITARFPWSGTAPQ